MKRPSERSRRGALAWHSGNAAEEATARYYESRGARIAARRWRGRAGEIDLILRERDGTVVFVEVRQRASAARGGAAASVSSTKQRRIIFAARHYLMRLRTPPPCRFDVVLVEDSITWLQAAFDAG